MKIKPEVELDLTRQAETAEKALRAEIPALVEKLAALVKDGALVKETAYLHGWLSQGIAEAEKFMADRKAKAEAKAAKPKAAKAKPEKAAKPSKQISPREAVDAGFAAAMF